MIVSNELLEAWSQRNQVAYSTDLVSALAREEDGETPFTPPVQTMYALREAALELLDEGVNNRISHYQGIADTLRDGLASLELELLVPREDLSNTMTTVTLPDGWSYEDLHRPLKDCGYVIYKSQAHLSRTTFRLGTIGLMTQDDIVGFLSALKKVLGR